MKVEDGTGAGYLTRVKKNNRLTVEASGRSGQAITSLETGLSFQASAEQAIGTTDVPILYLENNSNTHHMVITYVRIMSAGAAALSTAAYFTVKLGDSYTSGGANVTPTNVNQISGNVAAAVCKDGSSSLTVAGGTEIDKNYSVNKMESYNKEGSIVLGSGDSISIWHKGSTVAGNAYGRISFYYVDHSEI